MLKFFRRIRQQVLKKEEVNKYLAYAVGEILLVMISILLAISINNWNASIKLRKDRMALIQSMINDWEETSKKLEEVEHRYDSLTTNMERFMVAAYLENGADIPLDTLAYLAGSFFRYYNFEPNLTTFYEARSSGRLQLLSDRELPYLHTEFFEHLEDFDNHIRLCSDIYYQGSIWELRKLTGFISFYDEVDFFTMVSGEEVSREDYLIHIKNPLVSAALENQWNVISNLDKIVVRLRSSTDSILNKLEELAPLK